MLTIPSRMEDWSEGVTCSPEPAHCCTYLWKYTFIYFLSIIIVFRRYLSLYSLLNLHGIHL